MSSAQNPWDIPVYSLVNRNPYSGLLDSLYNWVGYHATANKGPQLVTDPTRLPCLDKGPGATAAEQSPERVAPE